MSQLPIELVNKILNVKFVQPTIKELNQSILRYNNSLNRDIDPFHYIFLYHKKYCNCCHKREHGIIFPIYDKNAIREIKRILICKHCKLQYMNQPLGKYEMMKMLNII